MSWKITGSIAVLALMLAPLAIHIAIDVMHDQSLSSEGKETKAKVVAFADSDSYIPTRRRRGHGNHGPNTWAFLAFADDKNQPHECYVRDYDHDLHKNVTEYVIEYLPSDPAICRKKGEKHKQLIPYVEYFHDKFTEF